MGELITKWAAIRDSRGAEETMPLLQEGYRKSRRKWSASRPTRGELGKCTYKATSSNSHGNKMEGFELCFHFLIFRFFICLFTSVCERLPGSFLSHTHCLPGFQNPSSLRTACNFSPSWQGQTPLLSSSLIPSCPPFSSCVSCLLPCNKSPKT